MRPDATEDPSPTTIAYDPLASKSAFEECLEARTRAIFTPVADIYDPFRIGASKLWRSLPRSPFKLVPSEFLRVAQRNRPHRAEATASAFADWVYSLYGRMAHDPRDLERGLEIEHAFVSRQEWRSEKLTVLTAGDDGMLHQLGLDWRQVHCGLHSNANQFVDFFELPELSVRGEALRASPDLVYRRQSTGQVVIVEIKSTRQVIPSNLWPNVWAQLWVYARIPVAKDAPQLEVVGEVWGQRYEGWHGRGPALYLRSSVRRDPRAEAFDRFFSALFDIYRGQ